MSVCGQSGAGLRVGFLGLRRGLTGQVISSVVGAVIIVVVVWSWVLRHAALAETCDVVNIEAVVGAEALQRQEVLSAIVERIAIDITSAAQLEDGSTDGDASS